MSNEIKRSDVWLADLGDNEGSEQRGYRPVLILQNDIGNFYAPTVIVASITDAKKKYIPTHVYIAASENSLFKNSVVMLEQIRTIDKTKLKKKVGTLSEKDVVKVNKAIGVSLAL